MSGRDVGLLSPEWAVAEAAALTSDAAVLRAMIEVERQWTHVLVEHGAGDASWLPAIDAACAEAGNDPDTLARAGVAGGNPVIPLVALLRDLIAARVPAAAELVHLGATSQDVLDTALALLSRRALGDTGERLTGLGDSLAALVRAHAETPMVGRTLGQHSLPITFGLKAAHWLAGVTAARRQAAAVRDALPLQWGGASGTLAALDVRFGAESLPLAGALAGRLELRMPPAPWQSTRWPALRTAAAAVEVVTACAAIGNDVALLSRPEIAELSEPAAPGRGVSSAMPQKRNPVLSVLLKSAGIAAPGALAQVAAAAAATVDERADGAWHAEWAPLRELVRSAGAAAERAAELVAGLGVHPEAMRANLALTGPLLASERLVAVLAPRLAADGLPDAREAVRAAVVAARDAGGDPVSRLRDAVGAERLARAAGPEELAGLADPAGYLGRTAELCDRVVADHEGEESA